MLPKIEYKLRWVSGILLLVFSTTYAYSFQSNSRLQVVDTIKLKASDKVEQLYKSNKRQEVLSLCQKELPALINVKDSLEIAWLSYYKLETQMHFKDFLEGIKTADLGIEYCPNDEIGLQIKGVLYHKKAYAEDYLGFVKRSLKSMQTASRLLSQLKESNDDYIIASYNFLSILATNNGDRKEASRYLRLSEKTYLNNKTAIDLYRTNADGDYDRYEVILLYKKINNLYKQGKTKTDSLELMRLLSSFEKLHDKPEFNAKYERVYYTSAINHVGDWYLSRKHDSLITTADLEKAHYHLDKSIQLVEDKSYPGNILTFQYNKCKALTLSNDLGQANDLISALLKRLSENDGRRPFFLAQKGLIQAKYNQKDSALVAFYEAIQRVHSGDSLLLKDYSNFKPNENFNQTKLLLRIAEVLTKYYHNDTEVKKRVAQLYVMALIQFENSYLNSKFNKTYYEYLNKIIKGILNMKKMGYGLHLIDDRDLLDRTETIKNQLEWKRFNQNRYANSLPKLDSLSFRELELRTLLTNAKLEGAINRQDSLYELIDRNELQTHILYPNLNALSKKHFKTEKLQGMLQDDQLVIKYVLLDDQLAVYKISATSFKVELQPWTLTEKELISNFTDNLKTQKWDANLAEKLGELLLTGIDENINQLIISPDGELYPLPFEVLTLNKQFVIEDFNLSYTSNLGFIHPQVNQSSTREELAVYVPEYSLLDQSATARDKNTSLSGAKKEAEIIASLFLSTIYSGTQLTKADFIVTSKKAKILHLAMHAQINTEEPALSRLLFSQNNTESEDLYLEELYGLNLGADLAVLSACKTAVGQENAGRSMESFQRAFTFAGVPATVASLWEVPDQATKQIMVSFYKNLKQGQVKSVALKNAKLEYQKQYANTKFEQPYYWAGFVLYGADNPVAEVNSLSFWIFVIAGIIIFAVLFWRKSRDFN